MAQSFAGPDQILGEVIDNLSRVVAGLAQQDGSLKLVIEQTRKIFEGLARQRDTLFSQVDSISTVLGRAAQVVQGAEPALNEFTTREPGFSQHFVDNRAKFAYLGYNLPIMLRGMSRIVDKGSYLDAYICEINFSVAPGLDPVLASLLDRATPSGHPEHSAICR
jgi:phospholipid/cholesterol/gamma-HCH transport system substrate-binding protein